MYGLCALMCGSVAALDGYAQFGNLEREAQYYSIRVYAQRYGFVFYTLYDYNRIRFQPYVFLMRAQITQIKYGYTQLLLYHISVVIFCRSLGILFVDG